METMIVLFTFALLLLIVPVVSGYRKHQETHRIDLMAGDEGED